MKKIKQKVDKLLLIIASVLLISMVLLAIWQVLARYVLDISSPSTEELIRYLLIWFGLMTAAYVFGAKKHIAILFFREKLPLGIQKVIEKLVDVLVILTAAILMIFGGIKVVLLTTSQSTAAMEISMAFVYLALPVSGLFIIFYTVYGLVTGKEQEDVEVEI